MTLHTFTTIDNSTVMINLDDIYIYEERKNWFICNKHSTQQWRVAEEVIDQLLKSKDEKVNPKSSK